jgi:3-oxoacyl-[acyl-carrier-protein] synthase II
MTRHRVVITGLGVVSSIGLGVTAFAEALKQGKSGISPIRSFDTTGFSHALGGEVQDFDPQMWLKRLDPATCGRTSQFAAAAARMAMEDAGIDPEVLSNSVCGAAIGTTDGESQLIDRLTAEWAYHGPQSMTPGVMGQVPAHRLALSVNRELNLHGEAVTIPTACAAGNYAIGYAFDLIQTGEADYMLCGGADSVCRKTFAGFFRLGAIAPSVCQPFDINRQGILTGEGAGMLLVERLDRALARGARIYAEVMGYGLSCDAKHMVAPDPVSIGTCMRRAHANAGIHAGQIDYISAHGTGTKVNDAVESSAIRAVFGDQPPPTSSIKSMIGHTMGAASALAAVACSLAVAQGFIPPTINFHDRDPDCAVDCVPNQARAATLNLVQNNGFAFGGNNAITIFGREPWVSQNLR